MTITAAQAAFHVGPGWAPVGPSWAPVGPRLGLTGAHLGMLLGCLSLKSGHSDIQFVSVISIRVLYAMVI